MPKNLLKKKVLTEVDRLYRRGDYGYVLFNYVSESFWADKLRNELCLNNIDNLTDFNYATCFSALILPPTKPKMYIFSDEFDDYLKEHGGLNGIILEVSAIAPYSVLKYISYRWENGERVVTRDKATPDDEIRALSDRLLRFLESNRITNIDDESILSTEVPGVSLELREDQVTVYNCLFEDNDLIYR